MKGYYKVILKDGKEKIFRYLARAFDCYYKEYQDIISVKHIDTHLISL